MKCASGPHPDLETTACAELVSLEFKPVKRIFFVLYFFVLSPQTYYCVVLENKPEGCKMPAWAGIKCSLQSNYHRGVPLSVLR